MVPDDLLPPAFKRAMRMTLWGARFGITSCLTLLAAEAMSWLVSAPLAWLVYAVAGATIWLSLWWLLGRIFRWAGLWVESDK